LPVSVTHRREFKRLVVDKMQGRVPSFSCINRIICALDEEHERGLAFELFAEGFLKTDPVLRARNVYTMRDLPPHLLVRLGVKGQDWGIDRIVETEGGDLITVQAKHRIDPRNSVTFNQISGFLYQSELAAGRMIITTSNRTVFDRGLRNSDSVQKVTARHLRDLSAERLQAILSYIMEGETPAPSRKVERDDQILSVANIVEGLSLHSRGIFDAACGSGKTLVSERVIESLFAKTGGLILCLAPSLSLVRQTLRNHAQELAGLGVAASFTVVCSDSSVAKDVTQASENVSDISADDLGVPVTTDVAQLADFLGRPSQPGEIRIIFSTYQSSSVVEEALKATGQVIGLTIFDEAHKTVTTRASVDNDFSRALFDEFIPSLKRLFMTATVKTRRLAKGRIDDSAATFLSMDRTDLYGPIIHRFSHSQAIAKGVIRAPKLILCTVDPAELPADLRDLEIGVDGLTLSGNAAAELFALRQAVEKTMASKVISFHTKIADAKAFYRLVQRTMPQFLVGHVNCTQRVSQRETAVDYLRSTTRPALVSNVRCLAEGIDVPEVDMIALFGHFGSKIDIAQMIGRALRKPAGCQRTYGYVLVPVVIANATSPDLSAEDMLDKAGLQTIRQVVCAMMDMDDDFAELVQRFRIARGVGDKKVLSSISRECLRYFECIGFAAEALTAAMTTTVLADISEDFWFHYGELKAFADEHGHTNLKPGHQSAIKGKSLHTWLENAKTSIRKKTITVDRLEALEALGVSTRSYGQQFDEGLALLTSFKERTGHVDVPKDAPAVLKEFVRNSRRSPENLSAERRAKLEALGFQFEHDKHRWFNENFGKLETFFKAHGHVTIRKDSGFLELLAITKQLRASNRDGTITPDQRQKLEDIGFAWNARKAEEAEKFEAMFSFFAERHKRTGSAHVPRRHISEDGLKVGLWLEDWRQRLRLNMVSDLFRQKLAKIGIVEAVRLDLIANKQKHKLEKSQAKAAKPNRTDETFNNFVAMLGRYVADGGSPNVPQGKPESMFEGVNLGNKLNHWLKKWRQEKGQGLPPEYAHQLTALGVDQYRDLSKVRDKKIAKKLEKLSKAA
jgi:superfamily II DNA or RNA helicase